MMHRKLLQDHSLVNGQHDNLECTAQQQIVKYLQCLQKLEIGQCTLIQLMQTWRALNFSGTAKEMTQLCGESTLGMQGHICLWIYKTYKMQR